MSVIAVVFFFLASGVLGSVWHHDEAASCLSQMVFDRTNGRVIVAGLNAIYMFDSLLQKLQMVETGPTLSTGNCSSATKCDNKQDNHPRVLQIMPDGRHLFFCGSAKYGLCSVYDLHNLDFNRDLSKDKKFIGSTIESRNNIAALFGSAGSLFIAKTFDDSDTITDPFALASFVLDENSDTGKVDLRYFYKSVNSSISSSVYFTEHMRKSFLVHYLEAFEHQGFIYFLTIQKDVQSDNSYHTKLVRVCQGDKEFNSYTELELSCNRFDFITQSHVSFNLGKTAHLSRMGRITRQKLNFDSDGGEEALFIVMGRGEPRGWLSEESAVCMFPMQSIQKEFVKLQRECYSGRGRILPWMDYMNPRCKMNFDEAKTIDNKFCGHPLNVGIGSRYPINAKPLYYTPDQSLTALRVTVINEHTVALAGTEKGLLLKIVLDEPDPMPYSTLHLNAGVSSSMVLDAEEKNLFVLSGSRITRLSLRTCDEYTDCTTCIGGHDPNLCGWCGGHCSTEAECSGTKWKNDSCLPIIYSFHPKKGPPQGGTLLQVYGDNFGSSSPDVKATVSIGNASCSIKFRNSSYILCKTSPHQANYRGELNVSVMDNLRIQLPYNVEGYDVTEAEYFSYLQPSVASVSPVIGARSGGTNVTITGLNLDIGSSLAVTVGEECFVINVSSNCIVCTTTRVSRQVSGVQIILSFDGTNFGNKNFTFLDDPLVTGVYPKHSIISGGQQLTVEGSNLNVVQSPRLCVNVNRSFRSCSEVCRVNATNSQSITCLSPSITSVFNVYDAWEDDVEVKGTISFIMDGVKDAWKKRKNDADNRQLRYLHDPRFDQVNKDSFISPNILKLEGSHLNVSAELKDYIVKVDDRTCNVTLLTNDELLCKLPRRYTLPSHYTVTVHLGYYTFKSEFNSLRTEHLQSTSFSYPHLFWIFLAAVFAVLLFTITIYTAWVRSVTRAKEKRSRTIPNVFYERAPRRWGTRGPRTDVFIVGDAYNTAVVTPVNGNSHLSNSYWSQTGTSRPSRQNSSTLSHNFLSPIDERTKQLLKDMNLVIPRNKITLLESIGQGHFGCVYRGYLQDDNKSYVREVAVKTLKSAPDVAFNTHDCKKFIEEAMTMQEFSHQHVLSLIGIVVEGGEGETTGTIRSSSGARVPLVTGLPMVVLPFMKHGDLLSYIRNEQNMPTVKNLMDFGIQIGRGMSYLSNLKFVHRDLAARNCMLDDEMLVKVADFGLSRDIYEREYYSSGDRKTALPIKWMAIESLEKGIYSTKSDVWSFGVVLWELLTRGVSPYVEVDSWDILKFLKQGRRLVQPTYCPPGLYRLMKKCWYLDPSLRPTFDELVTSIETIIAKMQGKNTSEPVATTNNSYMNMNDNGDSSNSTTAGVAAISAAAAATSANADATTTTDSCNEGSDDEDGYLKPLDMLDCSSLSSEHLQLVSDCPNR